MFRIVWITDPHLDFADSKSMERFLRELREAEPDAILIGGDIGEARSVCPYLAMLEEMTAVSSLYFVLGNHDYYRGGIAAVRQMAGDFSKQHDRVEYLSVVEETIPLTQTVGLIGHDGWADAREGDYHRSMVMMNDYRLIDELAAVPKHERLALLHELGDEAAAHIRARLTQAVEAYERVFLLTHVPPFRGACWYEGQISDDEWAPHFVCQAMGRAICDVASLHPARHVTVLCGHTHHEGVFSPAPNVRVITGAAEYSLPKITRVFDLAEES